MSKNVNDRIELLAWLEVCSRHLPVSRACTYDEGRPCNCRLRATSWMWPIRILLGLIHENNERVRNSFSPSSKRRSVWQE